MACLNVQLPDGTICKRLLVRDFIALLDDRHIDCDQFCDLAVETLRAAGWQSFRFEVIIDKTVSEEDLPLIDRNLAIALVAIVPDTTREQKQALNQRISHIFADASLDLSADDDYSFNLLSESAFSLKHLYEATQGQLLCGHVGTAYVFSSSDTEQNHSFSNAGLALLTDQEEDPTPFRRFPVHLYQQPDGRHIFDAGKAQHLTTKPAGAKEFWIIGTTSRGEPWLYPCPFSECDSCFTRPGKLSMHAATAHPQLIGKKFRVFTVQLHQPSMSVRFTAGVGGLYSIKRPLASTRSDGTVRTPAGKRQALFHRSAEQEPQVKSPPAKQQPAAHTAGQESEVLLRVKAEQALKAEQEKHAAEVKSQAAIAAATHRAEMAEAKVHYMESLQRTQDKSMESETACRQQFQAFAAEISSTLKQSVAVNALLVDSNLNLSSRKLLAQGSGLTPQIEEKRAGSEAQQVIAGRQAARFVAIPC